MWSRAAGTLAPVLVPSTTTQAPCQRFARNCTTRNLTSLHHAAIDSMAHLGFARRREGYAEVVRPPAHRW